MPTDKKELSALEAKLREDNSVTQQETEENFIQGKADAEALVSDKIRIAGYEALSRIAGGATLINATSNLQTTPTQEDLDHALNQLKLEKYSKLKYQEGARKQAAAIKINSSATNDMMKGVAFAALLGWKEFTINTESSKARLALGREALREGFDYVNLNAESDKEAQKLQRIFEIKKLILTPKLANKKKLNEKNMPEIVDLYEELGKTDLYPDGRELQQALLESVSAKQAAELVTEDKVAAVDMAKVFGTKPASMQKELLNALAESPEAEKVILLAFIAKAKANSLNPLNAWWNKSIMKNQLRTLLTGNDAKVSNRLCEYVDEDNLSKSFEEIFIQIKKDLKIGSASDPLILIPT